jgi:predicted Fe-Mo cluster-binding NifX family protein
MKVAVSASSPSLESPVDPRFGRCAYFVVVDPDTMLFETVDNTNALSSQGAGIGTAQTVAQLGATVVLTGNCGPNAFQALEAVGIEVVTGVSGSVREAVEGFKAGHYRVECGVALRHGALRNDGPRNGWSDERNPSPGFAC